MSKPTTIFCVVKGKCESQSGAFPTGDSTASPARTVKELSSPLLKGNCGDCGVQGSGETGGDHGHDIVEH
jgi:hypothetical protein